MTGPELAATPPTVLALGGRVVTADWGSPDLIAGLVGREPSGRPEAELWYGAHDRHPSTVEWQGNRSVLDVAALELPTFLVKLSAVAAPLSVQVHPDDAAAEAGSREEDARGIPLEAPERRFVDRSGKPELLRAITPMRVLCGLRSAGASRHLISTVAPSGFDVPLAALAQGDGGLRDVVALMLRAPAPQVRSWLAALVSGASAALAAAEDDPDAVAGEVIRLARLTLDLHARHPEDRGVLLAILLEDRDLAPGDAIYVAPGVPHAYLSGLGLEVMAASDNVLRAGMTSKPVDTEAFLALLDATVGGGVAVGALSHRVGDDAGWRRFLTPSDAFVLDEALVRGVLRVERTGVAPAVVLCLAGTVTVRAGDGSAADLGPGGAVLLQRGLDPVEVRGTGSIVHVRAGRREEPAAVRP